MAIHIFSHDPSGLLTQIKQGVDSGKIVTWSYDKDGDFLHEPYQWKGKAWFRPRIFPGKLTMIIFPAKGGGVSSAVYSAYHSHFIEMLLNHFDKSFISASATALAADGDVIKSLP